MEQVNGPAHYNGTEVIDGMTQRHGAVATAWFCILSSEKYELRAGKKPGNPIEQEFAKSAWCQTYATNLPPPPPMKGLFSRLRICWHILTATRAYQLRRVPAELEQLADLVMWERVKKALDKSNRP